MDKEIEKILSEITGYSIKELKDRETEPLLQPYDCLLAMNKALNMHIVSRSVWVIQNIITENTEAITDTKEKALFIMKGLKHFKLKEFELI